MGRVLKESSSEANRALGIIPPILPTAPWDIKSASITGPWRLHVVFNDGLEGKVDLEALIHAPNAGVFEALRDPSVFDQAYLQWGVLTWPGSIDLAPDAMHDAIMKTGLYAPGYEEGACASPDMRSELASLRREVAHLQEKLFALRDDLPSIIKNATRAAVREELARRRQT